MVSKNERMKKKYEQENTVKIMVLIFYFFFKYSCGDKFFGKFQYDTKKIGFSTVKVTKVETQGF